MERVSDLKKLAHLAWVIQELLITAASVREQERCLGDLRAHQVTLHNLGIARVRPRWPRNVQDFVRMRLHERHGHDDTCCFLGVSARVLGHFLKAATGVRGSALLYEAVMSGIEDCRTLRDDRGAALRAWERVHGRVPNHSLVVARIERVVSPQHPGTTTLPPTNTS